MQTDLLDAAPFWIDWTGMETDLIFNRDYDLPHFASFPMLDSHRGRQLLDHYAENLCELGERFRCGVVLQTPTWMASAERAAPLSYDAESLDRINREAVDLLLAHKGGPRVIVSGNIGPRGDAYTASAQTAEDFADYHAAQINSLAATSCDMIAAATIPTVDEAVGLLDAAKGCRKPVAMSFTVETDGKLPDGTKLLDAISQTDDRTDGAAAWFMVNCAHPEHIWPAIKDRSSERLVGIIANASRCSHAELDEAEVLDDGDPVALGSELAELRSTYPDIRILGGCCGTDLRHLAEIAQAA